MTTMHICMIPLNPVGLVIKIFLGRQRLSGLEAEKYSIFQENGIHAEAQKLEYVIILVFDSFIIWLECGDSVSEGDYEK